MARALRSIAARIGAEAPEGWLRGRVRAECGAASVLHHGTGYVMADGGRRDLGVPLGGLRKAYGLGGGSAEDLTVEMVVEPSGRFEALTSRAITRMRHPDQEWFLHVLRPGTLPREPGADQDPPSDPTPAGDPEEAVRLFREYLGKRADILGQEEVLPPPLDAAERAALLEDFHCELPPDLVALYGEADGDHEIGLFHGHPWFGLESTTTHVHHHREWKWTDNPLWAMSGEARPPGVIRRRLGSPSWIPFATSTGGDYLAVDMDPGPAGRPGQVIRVGIHYDGAPVYVADSVTAMLRRLVAALDRGDYHEEDGYLDLDAGLPGHLGPGKSSWRGIAPLPGKRLRRLHSLAVDKVKDLDLEAVRTAPYLRSVALFGEGPVDLRPLRETPLEALQLHLDSVDLEQLAGHPTLRVLSLATRDPVDLSVLRTFPRLEGLELPEAAVRGIGAIGELDGLLSLTLSFEQWRELDEVPPLAAAGLGGDPTLAQVDEWAARFTPDERLGGYEYHVGRVQPDR
ncbi:hypothetical protein GCM10009678_46650 [Actinomadura kijaniata]